MSRVRPMVVMSTVALVAVVLTAGRVPMAATIPVSPVLVRALAQDGPAAPTGLAVTAVANGTVRLRWHAPTSGPEPDGYLLEGGFEPGQVAGQLPLGSAPETEIVLAEGTYFLRVRTLTAAAVSEPSAEVRVVTGSAVPPSAPEGFTALVVGQSLSLSWTTTYGGGVPSSLWLIVDGPVSGALPLPAGRSTGFSNVPQGEYTLVLVAVNEAGFSPPSLPVTVQVPTACSGAPGPVRDVRSWRSGTTLTLEWAPPLEGAAATGYLVRIGGAADVVFETQALRISASAPPGHYTAAISALNACGLGPAEPQVDWAVATADGDALQLHFAPLPGVSVHRVFWSTSRADLEALSPAVMAVNVTASPVVLQRNGPPVPVYFRVAASHGATTGPPGPVAVAPVFETIEHATWPIRISPALFDLNGDGCLDLPGAWGRCDGGFAPYDVAGAGLAQIAAAGGSARDARAADFTGDGIVDIITNVYARADDPVLRGGLFVGRGDGTFEPDAGVAALGIRGFGETILAADFDNDGDVDVFLPHYTHLDDGGRNQLLVNDGQGRFTDRASQAGLAMNQHAPPEGAQALDWNDDGWLDILVGSQLFRNNGDLTFTDVGPGAGLPILFDEGLRLADVDLDGDLDLLHHDSNVTRLHLNTGGVLGPGEAVGGAADTTTFGYGLNVCDVNGDAYEDLLIARNRQATSAAVPRLLMNVAGRFVPSDSLLGPDSYNDLLACADLDGSGLPDIVNRWLQLPTMPPPVPQPSFRVYKTVGVAGARVRLRIVDAAGRRNQQGRHVRLRPRTQPGKTLLRIVEAGSGYMAQNGYDLVVGTPWPGDYDVGVRFAGGWVRTVAQPGAVLTIHEDGRVLPGLR